MSNPTVILQLPRVYNHQVIKCSILSTFLHSIPLHVLVIWRYLFTSKRGLRKFNHFFHKLSQNCSAWERYLSYSAENSNPYQGVFAERRCILWRCVDIWVTSRQCFMFYVLCFPCSRDIWFSPLARYLLLSSLQRWENWSSGKFNWLVQSTTRCEGDSAGLQLRAPPLPTRRLKWGPKHTPQWAYTSLEMRGESFLKHIREMMYSELLE